MSAPFTPDDAKALISDPTSSLCGNFTNTLLRLPVLFYQLAKYLFDSSGNPIFFLNAGDKIESFTPLAETDHRKLCNGQELSKTTYAVLYAAIGDVYATMDGQAAPAAGNFRVPKVGARFALPVGTLPSATAVTLGGVGGAETVTLESDEVPLHGHPFRLNPGNEGDSDATGGIMIGDAGGSGSSNKPAFTGTPSDTAGEQIGGAGGNISGETEAHANMPPYYGVYTYIVTGI